MSCNQDAVGPGEEGPTSERRSDAPQPRPKGRRGMCETPRIFHTFTADDVNVFVQEKHVLERAFKCREKDTGSPIFGLRASKAAFIRKHSSGQKE